MILLAAGCAGLERLADPPHRRRRPHDPSEIAESAIEEREVCYPGVGWDFETCFALAEIASPAADYDYPPPLDGSSLYAAPAAYLDLRAADVGAAVAPNFELAELADPADGDFAVVQVRAVVALQDLRDALGAMVVTSGYRNPAHNAAVGGVTWSRHMYGDAFDLVALSATLDELGDTCAAQGASYVGVYESHRHCDWRDGVPDPAFFDVEEWRSEKGVVRSAVIVREGGVLRAPASGWDEGEPLREWTASKEGRVMAIGWGRTFVPPDGADEVGVVVGREVEVRISCDAGRGCVPRDPRTP